MVTEPTRHSPDNTLDLFLIFTSDPTLIQKVDILPGLGDHNVVLPEGLIKPVFQKQKTQKVHLFAKSDWEKLKYIMKDFQAKFLTDPESIVSFEELKKSLTLINQTNSAVWLLGDFNLPKIDWENLIPSPECDHPTFYRDCLEVLDDCLLEKMVTSPTRGQNILDLFLTTNPTLVDNVSITPGLSDHDIVLIQVNVKPEVLKQVHRNIYLYKKANWDQLKQSMRDVYVELKQSDFATTTVHRT